MDGRHVKIFKNSQPRTKLYRQSILNGGANLKYIPPSQLPDGTDERYVKICNYIICTRSPRDKF